MIENHAEELTRGVIADLRSNPKTPSMHRLSAQELHDQSYRVYRNLSRWLVEPSDEEIKAFHFRLAQQRREEGIALSEVVYAHNLKKHHLRDYIRTSGMVDSAVDLWQEQELHHRIGSFFDKAVYYTVMGYEKTDNAEMLVAAARASA